MKAKKETTYQQPLPNNLKEYFRYLINPNSQKSKPTHSSHCILL